MRMIAFVAALLISSMAIPVCAEELQPDCEQSSDYQLKVRGCTRYIETHPETSETAWAYTRRGIAYNNLNKYAEAYRDQKDAVRIAPQPAIRLNYAALVLDMIEYDAENTGKVVSHQMAIDAVNTALVTVIDGKKLSSYGRYVAYYQRGRAYLGLQKYEDAIGDLTSAIKLQPKKAWSYKRRGQAYDGIGQTKKAAADYAKARALDPSIGAN